ncbi:MAG: hypothetical protein ACWA5X_00280 [bacterium]
MSLDFHIAKNKKEAPMKYGGAYFDEDIHETIFYKSGLLEGGFMYFRRMEDYYKDASYIGEEIEELLAEIKVLEKSFSENNAVFSQLNEIKRMCQKAIDKKLNLWVYCD